MKFPRRQIIVALFVYVGQILVGYGMGWTAPVIQKLQDPAQTPLPEVVSDTDASWIGSLVYIGTAIGPYISGFLSNVVGRRPCLFIGGFFSLLSYMLLALASNLAMIFTGRILKGVGVAIIMSINYVYIGEIASTNIRGILLTCTAVFLTFGTVVVYSVAPYVPYSVSGYIGVALTLVYIVGIVFIPESPLFLVMKGRDEEAKQTLTLLGRPEDIDIVTSSKDDYDVKKGNKNQWSEIFTIKSNRKALFITLTLNILQQMSGVGAVVFFATTIFELADSSVEPNIATIIIGLTQFTASCVTPFFVDRTGRKSLMLFSTSGCALSLGILGTYFYLYYLEAALESVTWVPLVSLIMFFFSFDLGFGIIPFTFIGEMFTPNVRSTGSTVTISTSWLFGFGVVSAFGYILELGPYFAFWFFAGACTFTFVFTIIFVPETKGKTLAEIQKMLN